MRPHLSVARLAVAFAAVAWVGAAAACPVCFAAKGEANRKAFVSTTVFMSALPLLMVGTCVWWVARRVREHELRASEPSNPSALIDDDVHRLTAHAPERPTKHE